MANTSPDGPKPVEDDKTQQAPPPPPPPADPPADPPVADAGDKGERIYGVYQTVELDLSSAAALKEAAKQLQELSVEGKLVVLARVGRSPGKDPRKALLAFGDVRELDGDYQLIANGAVNNFDKVKTERETRVKIG